ncbi:105/110 kDa heat shock protein, nucleotide-binding domain [Giardia duodenalis]|uniref:105/110 kDa heat shock protein, nucleotide-binding domain n=1 Tax=Giardia intestinalis TaxID=5741 RepID=V6TTT3_GIAIN|nr:105/110 kDa heat shock protein, nucleotide-binding domain [Giardia intestinalis]
MSSIAFDFGNSYAVASVPRARGVDLVLSDTSNRLIPSCVSYTSERRFMGDMGIGQRTSNRRACFFNLPMLLNEDFGSHAVQRVVSLGAEFVLTEDPSTHKAYGKVFYGGQEHHISTENMTTAILGKVRDFANSMDNVSLSDFVVGCPGNWNHSKRAALRASCEALGLTCNGVVTQHMAAAVTYYVKRNAEFRAMSPENQGIHLGILSIGELQSFFSILRIHKTGIQCVFAEYDDTVGAADFDKILYNLVCEQIKAKFRQISPEELRSGKNFTKIMKACNAAKKVLSINSKAPVHIECLGDAQIDVNCMVTAQEFEELSFKSGLMNKLEAMITKGLQVVKGIDNVEAFELIGGASRMQSIRTLSERLFTAEKITKRLNPDECIVVGLGWIAAIRSPRQKVAFSIEMVDIISNIQGPISLDILHRETMSSIYQTPLKVFQHDDVYPCSRKVSKTLSPGEYIIRLVDVSTGTTHEESVITVAPRNIAQFNEFSPEELAKHSISLDTTDVTVSLKMTCDTEGFFHFTQLRRTDPIVRVKKVLREQPNPKWTEEIEAQEVEKEKAAETQYTSEVAQHEAKLKELNDALASAADTEKDAVTKEIADHKAKAPKKQIVIRTPKTVQVPVEEKEVATEIVNIDRQVLLNIGDTTALAKQLEEFEKCCKDIDRKALRYEHARNTFESLVYDTRNDMDWGKFAEFTTEEDKKKIIPHLDEHSAFINTIEGPHQTAEIEERIQKLEDEIRFLYERKESHDSADLRLMSLRNSVDSLLEKWPANGTNNEARDKLMVLYKECEKAVQQASKHELAPLALFENIDQRLAEFEKALQAKAESAKPSATSNAAPKEDDKSK